MEDDDLENTAITKSITLNYWKTYLLQWPGAQL